MIARTRSALPLMTRSALIALAALALPACVGSYTGPVEVTRFVAEQRSEIGQGPIVLYFPDEMSNELAQAIFADAVESELSALGYTIVDQEGAGIQVATIRTSRTPLAAGSSRGPVSVGVGGGTGGYRSGVGVGIGINLGGGQQGPNVLSELSVRISGPDGASLWEGRAQQPVSMKSPYADVDASARALAAALFKDFPGGNGETVSIDVDDL
ncbi:MAG: hypothetical protein AAF697_10390 [Pseudomonadota bacterium]